MALVHRVSKVSRHPANIQNILCEIAHTDSVSGQSFATSVFGTDISPELVAKHCSLIDDNWAAGESALAALKAIEGQEIAATKPVVDADLLAYQKARAELAVLSLVKSEDAALVALKASLTAEIETYIKANPDKII